MVKKFPQNGNLTGIAKINGYKQKTHIEEK